MKVNAFYTTGQRDINEWEYNKPDIGENEIEVKNIYTGMCSSDLAMYTGNFQTLPKEIQGHEGLGVVTKVGQLISDANEGDIVATRGEPAFADYYNCAEQSFVVVPNASPKYILEPVACALNIAMCIPQHLTNERIIILGSGWLATVVHTALQVYKGYRDRITVVGSANYDYWSKQNVDLLTSADVHSATYDDKFDLVIDLSEKASYFDLQIFNDNAIILLAAEKHDQVLTDFANYLWKGTQIIFPSPRKASFYRAMRLAENYVTDQIIDTDSMWTHQFGRHEVKHAFDTGLNRPQGYKRGFIKW